jgi:hypothetical protein
MDMGPCLNDGQVSNVMKIKLVAAQLLSPEEVHWQGMSGSCAVCKQHLASQGLGLGSQQSHGRPPTLVRVGDKAGVGFWGPH